MRLPLGVEVGVTGFYNPLFRTVEHSVTELLFPSNASAVSSGTAYGAELFVKRSAAGRWFGWVAATLQRSERVATVYRFSDDGTVLGQLQATIPSSFDQTLVLHAVLGVRLPYGISAGASLHFNTGRPEDGGLSSRTQRMALDPVTASRTGRRGISTACRGCRRIFAPTCACRRSGRSTTGSSRRTST